MAALPVPIDEGQISQYDQKPGLLKYSRQVFERNAPAAAQPVNHIFTIVDTLDAHPLMQSIMPSIASQPTWTILTVPRLETVSEALTELEALRGGEGDSVPPTDHAFANACAVIDSAYRLLWAEYPFAKLPFPIVSTDDLGGVRFAWQSGRKLLRANFGALPASRSYLYFESGNKYGAESLQAAKLSERLSWIVSE